MIRQIIVNTGIFALAHAVICLGWAPYCTAVESIRRPGYVISVLGRYRLETDLAFGQGFEDYAILIKNTRDVFLDLNGKKLVGPGEKTAFVSGIIIRNCENVEIEGAESAIGKCRQALRIEQSSDIKIEGEGLRIYSNILGVDVRDCSDVRLEELVLQNTLNTGFRFTDNKDCNVFRSTLHGPSETGFFIADCENTSIEQSAIGDAGLFNTAGIVITRASKETVVSLCKIGSCRVAIAIGTAARDTEISSCKFGVPKKNGVDLKFEFGAERPFLIGNIPEELTE